MPTFPFQQVDVFSAEPLKGNPLAVVVDADGIPDDTMAAFGRWTNLSETTFLLKPTHPDADYRVRIFTPERELPFAGHPTLGTARAWLEAGGTPRDPETIVQECGLGLVRLRRDGDRLAFAAPNLLRGGPVEPDVVSEVVAALGLDPDDVRGAQWCDNGPGWVALLLKDADAVLAIDASATRFGDHDKVGVVGPHPDGGDVAFEVRAFFPGGVGEDPVTGSLNAALAQWLIREGVAPDSYVAAQGTAMRRRGRIHVDRVGDDVWVGGDTVIGVLGTVDL